MSIERKPLQAGDELFWTQFLHGDVLRRARVTVDRETRTQAIIMVGGAELRFDRESWKGIGVAADDVIVPFDAAEHGRLLAEDKVRRWWRAMIREQHDTETLFALRHAFQEHEIRNKCKGAGK